jgi:hypothetical protein
MMTVIDVKKTASTSATYQTNTESKDPAPRNLHLEIVVGPTEATVRCSKEEHVGSHANRMVTIRADRDCTLEFDNEKVFGKKEEVLLANTPKHIAVTAGMSDKVWTYCQVRPTGRIAATQHNSPPKIVVP